MKPPDWLTRGSYHMIRASPICTLRTSHHSRQNKSRSEDNFQTQETIQKIKAFPIDTIKRLENKLNWNVLFFRHNCEKNKYFIDVYKVKENQCEMFSFKSSAYMQLYFGKYTLIKIQILEPNDFFLNKKIKNTLSGSLEWFLDSCNYFL
jgi:hypothetical protein